MQKQFWTMKIRPHEKLWHIDLGEIWRYRDLIELFVRRNIVVQYKQTPHMLAHTEQYSRIIDKYMIRHFVKPGVTGWAQVTGFRGETQELWQMEGRVEHDIWYIQHWSVWLDILIIWRTIKSIFVHDKNAY